LEADYQERQGGYRRGRCAFVLGFFAMVCLGTSVMEALGVPGLFLAWLPWRLGCAALFLVCGAALRSPVCQAACRGAETLLIAAPFVLFVMLTEWIGEYAGPWADRYMMGAAFSAPIAVIVMPLSTATARIVCGACLMAYPLVPALLPRALPLAGNWDLIVFAAGALASASFVAKRAERRDRLAFLYRCRHELSAAEMNVMNAELLRLSTIDALTGLQNRRAFNTALARVGQDRSQTLCIALVDVDWFKAYNDTAGHIAGDEALRAVARAIQGAVRAGTDIAARYGGEEFVVLMPDMPYAEAHQAGERLRQAVLALGIPHPGRNERPVSISVGLACAAARHAGSTELMLREADAALYAAKQRGRNAVVLGASLDTTSQDRAAAPAA